MIIEISREPDHFATLERVGWDASIGGYGQAFGVGAG